MKEQIVTRRMNVSRAIAIASLILSKRWHNSDFCVFLQLASVVTGYSQQGCKYGFTFLACGVEKYGWG
jgi:hypothetical protein